MKTEELPIFPLTGVVLFPEVQAPLHIFEPRYRQMTEAALAGSQRIGMVVIPPEHAHETAGDPPLHPIGCAGAIRQSRKLPDGRYNLVLEGTHRFRIHEERARPAERLYRVATVALLPEPFPETDREPAARLRQQIVDHMAELVRRSAPGRAQQLSEQLFQGVHDAAFVNSLCQALSFPVDEKLALLDAPDVLSRSKLLEGLLGFRVAGLGAGGSRGSQSVH
jgi:Lon protease-like protein